MSTLDRYIAQAILVATSLVLMVLVALDRLFAFIGQLDDVGKGEYNFEQLLLNVLFNTPGSIYEVMAIAALLGGLLGLGALANHSELIVARSSGMSLLRLSRPMAIVGAIFAAGVFLLGEWVVPSAEERATRVKLQALSQSVSVGGSSGLWLREKDRYINVRRVLPELNLQGISIYHYSGGRLERLVTAGSASYQSGLGWTLNDVERHTLDTGGLEIEQLPALSGVSLLNPEMLRGLSLKPEMLSARELYENVGYLKRNKLQASAFELAFWSKFSVPLSSIVMLLIALPFVLGSRRVSSGGQRIFIGSLIGIVFLLLSKVSSQVGIVFGLHGALGAFFPTVLFAVIAVAAVRRVG